MESTPEQVAIIGDDVSNDLGGGAKELGLHRFLGKCWSNVCQPSKCTQLTPTMYLVQTGKYRPEDSNQDTDLHVFKSVVEAVDHIIAQYNKP